MDLYQPDVIDTFAPVLMILILGIFLFSVIRGILEWIRNNSLPKTFVKAQVTDKSEKKNTNIHYNDGGMTGAHSIYTTADIFYMPHCR